MQFSLKDLELFIAVAETGSIAKAAQRSHTVASAVSKRISDMEDGFHTALLTRGSRGVERRRSSSRVHSHRCRNLKSTAGSAQLDRNRTRVCAAQLNGACRG